MLVPPWNQISAAPDLLSIAINCIVCANTHYVSNAHLAPSFVLLLFALVYASQMHRARCGTAGGLYILAKPVKSLTF